MKLKVKIDELANVELDLDVFGNNKVKIALPGNPHPVEVYKDENASTPMTANDFRNHVRKCGDKGVGIVTEENISGSKAWICDSDDLDDVKEVNCSMKREDNCVLIHYRSGNQKP